jgi:hypothetical protein
VAPPVQSALRKWLFLAALVASVGIPAQEESPRWESIEWSDIWVANADDDSLPRVLLVGDSIARGYYGAVETELRGKASCARYTTSKFAGHSDFLAELTILLDAFDFDVIHINNGLHGWDYSEDEYAQALPRLLEVLNERAPDAKVIWASTTPVRSRTDAARFDELNARVQERNRMASDLMQARGMPVHDLYALMEPAPEHYAPDGVHFNEEGRRLQGRRVAETVAEYLPVP